MNSNPTVSRRGQRAVAAATCAISSAAIVAPQEIRTLLAAALLLNLGVGTVAGPTASPLALLWRQAPRRLREGGGRELAAAARFAQGCGLMVAGPALVASYSGAHAVAVALLTLLAGLSGLLATVDICVGCRLYGILTRAKRVGIVSGTLS